MLFNSYGFIFLFLPIVFLAFYRLSRISHSYSAAWLALSSLFFYAYWNPAYIGLILGSIIINYSFGTWIAKAEVKGDAIRKKQMIVLAISSNLILLGYYKYTYFFIENFNTAMDTHISLGHIILPLGISFFTFTQIAFLVDTYKGKVKEYNFIHYLLFITYFPHLIAGPILHHKEMMPQFSKEQTYRFSYENLSIGLTIFFIGLFKKTVLADGIGTNVDPVFIASASGIHLSFVDAWGGALCYSLQLYFDFSGYSDMAIGLSRLFGVTLPINFHSPYKSVNIIEFWHRWHMTLSRFLREYLYIPLGGNRKGNFRRYLNLIITMLLGGLWHGAGWTYVLWGGLHGLYLTVNHGWQSLRKIFLQDPLVPLSKPMHIISALITFLAVTVAWVVFRANSINAATGILKAMAGMNGVLFPDGWLRKWGRVGKWLATNGYVAPPFSYPLIGAGAINWILISLLIVWLAPNTQQILNSYRPGLDIPDYGGAKLLLWRPSYPWLVGCVLSAVFGILSISELSEFIYFQF